MKTIKTLTSAIFGLALAATTIATTGGPAAALTLPKWEVNDGTLEVHGTDRDDFIRAVPTDTPGTYALTLEVEDTGAETFSVSGVTEGVAILGGAGNDYIVVDPGDGVNGNVVILAGHHDDVVFIGRGPIHGTLHVHGNHGNDTIETASTTIDGRARILLGDGDNTVLTRETTWKDHLTVQPDSDGLVRFQLDGGYFARGVKVLGGNLGDHVDIAPVRRTTLIAGTAQFYLRGGDDHVTTGGHAILLNSSFVTGDGNDTVEMTASQFQQNGWVNTGADDDTVLLDQARTRGGFLIEAGTGDDLVDIFQGRHHAMTVKGYGGADLFRLRGGTYVGPSTFDGGTGDDTLQNSVNIFEVEPPTILNVETIHN